MSDYRKVIAVCGVWLSEEKDYNFISDLNRICRDRGYVVIAFNFSVDSLDVEEDIMQEKKLMELMGQDLKRCSGCDYCSGRHFPLREGEREIRNLLRFRPLMMGKMQAARLLKEDVLGTWETKEIEEAIDLLVKERKIFLVGNRLVAAFSFAWGGGTWHTPSGGTYGNTRANQGGHAPRNLPRSLWNRR